MVWSTLRVLFFSLSHTRRLFALGCGKFKWIRAFYRRLLLVYPAAIFASHAQYL